MLLLFLTVNSMPSYAENGVHIVSEWGKSMVDTLNTLMLIGANPEKASEIGGGAIGTLLGGGVGAGIGGVIGHAFTGGDVGKWSGRVVGGYLGAKALEGIGENLGAKDDLARNFLIKENEVLGNIRGQINNLFQIISYQQPINSDISTSLNTLDGNVTALKNDIEKLIESQSGPGKVLGTTGFVIKKMPLIKQKTVNFVKSVDEMSSQLGQ